MARHRPFRRRGRPLPRSGSSYLPVAARRRGRGLRPDGRALRPGKSTTGIEWPVVVLLGSMIPLGSALEALRRDGADRRSAAFGHRGACRPGGA